MHGWCKTLGLSRLGVFRSVMDQKTTRDGTCAFTQDRPGCICIHDRQPCNPSQPAANLHKRSKAWPQSCCCGCPMQPIFSGLTGRAGAEEGKASTTLAQLNGTWRLVYSSAFQQGGLGNSGLPTFVSPFQLGQVRPGPCPGCV